MYTLLGYFRHTARLAADMRLSDLRYPINFVVKHQILPCVEEDQP